MLLPIPLEIGTALSAPHQSCDLEGLLIAGSPPCSMASQINEIIGHQRGHEIKKREREIFKEKTILTLIRFDLIKV
jgi:hypothetical protein